MDLCEDALNAYPAERRDHASSDAIQDGENEIRNSSNVEDEDRYLRASLREKSLDDLFSNNKETEDSNEVQNMNEIAPEIKREVISDTEEEESEEVEQQMEEQEIMQNSIMVKEEVESDELSTNNDEVHNSQSNRSIVYCDPSGNQEGSSSSSATDPLPDIQGMLPATTNRLVQLSSIASSSAVRSENQSLKYTLRKSTASKGKVSNGEFFPLFLNFQNLFAIDLSHSNTDMESEEINLKRQKLNLGIFREFIFTFHFSR